MKIKIEKLLGNHVAFILREVVATKREQYYSRKRFRALRRFWMRVIANYWGALRWYFPFFTKLNTGNAEPIIVELINEGYATLQNVDLAEIDFVKINKSNDSTVTTHNVIMGRAREFAKKHGFDAITKKYLGVDHCFFYSRAWRLNALPTNRTKIGNLEWHRDRDGYSELKFFIYLSDVPEGEGEHVIAVGSNRRKPFKFVPQRRYSDQEVMNEYAIKKVLGKQGMCFVEDTSCLHKGSYPGSKNRDMVMFVYFTGPIYWDKDTIDIYLEQLNEEKT